MPSYKVGARGEGAISALVDLAQYQRERAVKEEDEVRTLRQRVQALVLADPNKYAEEFVQSMVSGLVPPGTPVTNPSTFDPIASGLVPSIYTDPKTQIGYARPYASLIDRPTVLFERGTGRFYRLDEATGRLVPITEVPPHARVFQSGETMFFPELSDQEQTSAALPVQTGTPPAMPLLRMGQRNPRIAQRIQELRQHGMDNETIAGFLREKGIDPAIYGL